MWRKRTCLQKAREAYHNTKFERNCGFPNVYDNDVVLWIGHHLDGVIECTSGSRCAIDCDHKLAASSVEVGTAMQAVDGDGPLQLHELVRSVIIVVVCTQSWVQERGVGALSVPAVAAVGSW